MTVIDLRNIFSDRSIELADVTRSFIYYVEEKNQDGHNDIFLLEYNRSTRRERLVANYSLDDPTFVEHIFAFEKTIIMVLENGSNSLWLLEIDKKTGDELNRRKIVCTGLFRSCLALDGEHLLIYMSPDDENAEMFRKYKEVTGSDCLCYLYDLKTNQKHFVRSRILARLGIDGIRVANIHGQRYVILLDPFADEEVKEHYYREQRWINVDIRDNIWICNLYDMVTEIENGADEITKKSIASADIKALVRYMGIGGDKIYFRAKEFRGGTEKICSYNAFVNTIGEECDVEEKADGSRLYIIDEKPFKTFSVEKDGDKRKIRGVVGSSADFEYDKSLGKLVTCIDNRYAILLKEEKNADGKVSGSYINIYDSGTKAAERYDCNCRIEGSTVVLY